MSATPFTTADPVETFARRPRPAAAPDLGPPDAVPPDLGPTDPADAGGFGGDLLPTCCLTGILGGFGSIVVFGATAAAPCLIAAAVGVVVGLIVARA